MKLPIPFIVNICNESYPVYFGGYNDFLDKFTDKEPVAYFSLKPKYILINQELINKITDVEEERESILYRAFWHEIVHIMFNKLGYEHNENDADTIGTELSEIIASGILAQQSGVPNLFSKRLETTKGWRENLPDYE